MSILDDDGDGDGDDDDDDGDDDDYDDDDEDEDGDEDEDDDADLQVSRSDAWGVARSDAPDVSRSDAYASAPVAPSTKGPTADGQAVGTAKVKEAGFIREPVASCYLGYSWGEPITIVIFMYLYIVINNPQKLGGYNPCNNG